MLFGIGTGLVQCCLKVSVGLALVFRAMFSVGSVLAQSWISGGAYSLLVRCWFSVKDKPQEGRAPMDKVASWTKGSLTRHFGQATFANTVLQCGVETRQGYS